MSSWLAGILSVFCILTITVTSKNNSCDSYITYSHKKEGETVANFRKNVEEDNIYSFFIGFTFTYPIDKMKVYGKRMAHKVNSTLWFVNLTEDFKINLVNFDFMLIYGLENEISKVTFNGEIICDIYESGDTTEDKMEVSSAIVAFSCFNILLTLTLGSLIVVLLVKISKLRGKMDEYWQETISQVTYIQRSLSLNNPNKQGVPLPNIPIPTSCSRNKRGTYIDLKTYQAKHSMRFRSAEKLPKRLTSVDHPRARLAHSNDYVIQQRRKPSRDNNNSLPENKLHAWIKEDPFAVGKNADTL